MMKTFLYVHGDGDYDAMEFEQNYDPQEFYENMIKQGYLKTSIEEINGEETNIEVKIIKYEVSDSFLNFMNDHLLDYDDLKRANIFEVRRLKS